MEPVERRRRRRPAVSCIQCRQRKVRCDRQTPCSNCAKTRQGLCDYSENPRPTQKAEKTNAARTGAETDAESRTPAVASLGSTTAPNTPASTQPEDSPAFSSTSLTPGVTKACFTGLSDAFYIHYEKENPAMQGSPQNIPRLVAHKTRLFGQSHWVSSSIILFRDLIALLEKGDTTQAFADIQRCKALGKLVKTRRSPPWPTIPTPELPSKQVADALVECYLQTTESLYRVLHIPTFQRAYDALWVPGNNRDMAIIIQVKLVMAIGTTTYDDEFSLRTSAIRWIHEAMVWNSDPETYKPRLTIQGLQNHILLILAQSVVGVGKDMVWPSTGFLVRTAMQMGLHRDPSRLQPPVGVFAAQMRRRLWNTVIELALQCSFDTGEPMLLSLDDFDTSPPSNFNDADLETGSPDPLPSPPSTLTQTTIPIAFRHSFPQRLAIVRFLNGLPSSSPEGHYAATLALDASLHTAYRTLAKTLRPFSPANSLAISLIDILTRRYLLALHVPFLEPALTNQPPAAVVVEKFLYSRATALENALRIWNATKPSPTTNTQKKSMVRLVTNGAPFLRTLLVQSVFVLAAELRAQLLAERESLVVNPARGDLVCVVREAEEWALRCIRVGETNVKGFLFLRLVRAQIEGLLHVGGEEEWAEGLVKAAEEAGRVALGVMEGMAGEEESGEEVVDFQMTMSDFLFGFENAETMSWEFQ